MGDLFCVYKIETSCKDLANNYKSLAVVVDKIDVSIAKKILELKDLKTQKAWDFADGLPSTPMDGLFNN